MSDDTGDLVAGIAFARAAFKLTTPVCHGCGTTFEGEFMDAWCAHCLIGWHAECMVAVCPDCKRPTKRQPWV